MRRARPGRFGIVGHRRWPGTTVRALTHRKTGRGIHSVLPAGTPRAVVCFRETYTDKKAPQRRGHGAEGGERVVCILREQNARTCGLVTRRSVTEVGEGIGTAPRMPTETTVLEPPTMAPTFVQMLTQCLPKEKPAGWRVS